MNLELEREEEQTRARLTTAAVADAGEPMALKNDFEVRRPETELPRVVRAGSGSTLTDTAASAAAGAPTVATDEQATPLFSPDEAKAFRARWDAIQGGFVDEPRRAVAQADGLVEETMTRLAAMFASERATLEGQWDRDESVSTENLRLALRRYRSFFGRLLAV
jgi:hypothetical protein